MSTTDPLAEIDSLLAQIENSIVDAMVESPHGLPEKHDGNKVANQLASARDELVRARQERDETTSKSKMLAKSQAEALVNSAEIITELEETKKSLQESHEAERKAKVAAEQMIDFGNILDESDNEIYLFDVDSFLFVHVNQGARRNLGYSMDELRVMTPFDLKPDFDLSKLLQYLRPLQSCDTTSVQFATMHQRKDGSLYPVDVHVHRSTFENRAVFVAVILDATQKKEAEEQIRKLSVAVEQSPNSIIIADVEGVIEYVNPMFATVRSKRTTNAIGQCTSDVLRDLFSEQKLDELWKTVRNGNVWRGEFKGSRENGELFWESVSVSPIRDARGNTSHFLFTFQDISENKRLWEQMEHLAFHDSLTDLPNRTSILKTIQKAIDRSSRFAILFLDFDRFKLINDSLGHKMGDELLKQISERIRNSLRANDNVVPARLGGDEFVVFLNDLRDWDSAARVAERLLQLFSTSYRLCGNTVHSTASIGVVTNEIGYTSADEMLRDADLAMYEAKAKGRACYVAFNQSMHQRAETRLQVECDLRKAIDEKEIVLHYQPIVSLETGHLEGVETLVRWNHPEKGLVYPDNFIPVAEETGLILPIGEQILFDACRQFSEWQKTLGERAPRCIHVNVSRLQMLLPNLTEMVRDCLRENQMDPHCLHLEVTESIVMQDTSRIVKAMHELHELGVRIDMDDFGTGYSSLSCLHEFPIDFLKIDRSFIDSAREVSDYIALLHGILSLADNLNLQVVAEGIESVDQLVSLQAMGCEFGQGYYFSKPISASDFEIYANGKTLQLSQANIDQNTECS